MSILGRKSSIVRLEISDGDHRESTPFVDLRTCSSSPCLRQCALASDRSTVRKDSSIPVVYLYTNTVVNYRKC